MQKIFKLSIKNILELISKFNKVAGHQFNIQKSILFLHISNKQFKNEIKKVIKFMATSTKIKYLGIHSAKDVKYLYVKNYKLQLNYIQEDLNKQKYILCICIRRLAIANMVILYKLIYRINAIHVKIPAGFFQ